MTGCCLSSFTTKSANSTLPHCPLPKAWSPQTCLSLHFEDDCYPFLHQVYWRFKTKYNNYQNSLNYKWEKGMQNRLTDPQLMRRQFFREWPKRYAGLPEAECLNNSRKLSSLNTYTSQVRRLTSRRPLKPATHKPTSYNAQIPPGSRR